MFTLNEVKTDEEIKSIEKIAYVVWHETYDSLGSEEITDNMLKNLQSAEAVKKQINEQGYIYFMLRKEGKDAGFVGLVPDKNVKGELLLSKAYILSEFRGRGGFKYYVEIAKELRNKFDQNSVWLMVNKRNERAIEVYKKYGFLIEGENVTHGEGYVMDDYIMRLK